MTGHASETLLARYTSGDPDIPGDQLWAVEAHLENCADCRAKLTPDPLLTTVWSALEPELVTPPAKVRRLPRFAAWASPSMMPWLAMTTFVTAVAVLIDLTLADSFAVLLVAPVAPVLGVAAAWSRGLDPAYELTVATPRAGLQLVLRRTLAVLAAVLPPLVLFGWLAGDSPALWLLPCLAVTAGTLALGGLIGVQRAAIVIALLWTALVIGPSLLTQGVPAVFEPAGVPAWGIALLAGAVIVVTRSEAFTRLGR
ncbi:zf-HC2 domain-containing protein [Amycolatopsis sp. cg5]|uniref:zf-HC2 domain-containing protein n=1 Tax=Amycolatopsis sp. cg5 TaxID=3238802 RepID=UPI003523848D